MKILMILIVLTSLAACEPYSPPTEPRQKSSGATHIEVWHDEKRGVTCWLWGGTNGGISCLPDGALQR